MTYEQFQAQVDTIAATLLALKDAPAPSGKFGSPNVDYDLNACEAAAAITGTDPFFAKAIFNREFREAGKALVFERALAEATA